MGNTLGHRYSVRYTGYKASEVLVKTKVRFKVCVQEFWYFYLDLEEEVKLR